MRISFSQSTRRLIHTSSSLGNGTLGRVLKSLDEISSCINHSTWNVKDLIKADDEMQEVQIEPKVLKDTLKLSGLSTSIDSKTEKKLIDSLKMQMLFIRHLYDRGEKGFDVHETNNNDIFRLIASDHRNDVVDLSSLTEEIEKLEEDVDQSKGETDGSLEEYVHKRENDSFFSIKLKD